MTDLNILSRGFAWAGLSVSPDSPRDRFGAQMTAIFGVLTLPNTTFRGGAAVLATADGVAGPVYEQNIEKSTRETQY